MENHKVLSVKELTTQLRLNKQQLITVVDHLSFDLEKEQTLGIVGESGSGKSMMALSLMRILPSPPALPSTGEVLYRGNNILSLSDRAMRKLRGKNLAMIFQDPMSCLNPVYTIGYQLLEVVELHLNLYGEEAFKKCISALEELGIPSPEEQLNAYPHQLSGGMKQRIMIAMALLCEPDILIADEPTTALDVTTQAQILALMKRLQHDHGTAIIFISHDMGVIKQICDNVIVMYAAQPMEAGPTHSVFHQQAHPYTQGLLSSRPSLSQEPQTPLPTIMGSPPSLEAPPKGCAFHPRCPQALKVCSEKPAPYKTLQPGHQAQCWLHETP